MPVVEDAFIASPVRTVQFLLERDWKGRDLAKLQIVLWVRWPPIPKTWPSRRPDCQCTFGVFVTEDSVRELYERFPHLRQFESGGRCLCQCVGRIIE